jgi:hypothetical protein
VAPDAANPFDQDLNSTDSVEFHDMGAYNVVGYNITSTNANIYDIGVSGTVDANIVTAVDITATQVTANYFFGDGSNLTNLPIPTSNNAIQVSDTAPNANVEGNQWFNSATGRTYVTYNNQWVDSSPQSIDPLALRTNDDNNIEVPKSAVFADGRIYQDYSNTFSSMRWTNMTSNTEMLRAYKGPFNDGNEQDEVGQLGVSYQGSNVSGLYIKSFNTETNNTWTFEGTGNLRFPDDTVQTTAYSGQMTLLDGGQANTWLDPI